ncbi:MAG: mevalonate kinase [Gammaproteobacteria bacterium]
MAQEFYKASAPGSLMLFGEHAVLHGKKAIVASVQQRITVTIAPRKDEQVNIASSLGRYHSRISDLKIEKPFQFVLTCLTSSKKYLSYGYDITIDSNISDTVGLGSSAAVTVATLAALNASQSILFSKQDLLIQAKKIILDVQGMGSGADLAASIYGGIVSYRSDPLEVEMLPQLHDISLIYTGSKTPTTEVIKHVATLAEKSPEKYRQLYDEIDLCAQQAVSAIQKENWVKVGELMNQQQSLMQDLGVSNGLIDSLIEQSLLSDAVLGAKISGSGLGDCILILGRLQSRYFPRNEEQEKQGVCMINTKLAKQGVSIESS